MLTTIDIENQIKDYKMTQIKFKDYNTEFKLRAPFFMMAFQKFVNTNNRVPGHDEFVAAYKLYNRAFFATIDGYTTFALECRARRAYPSLIRDLHFTALLQENGIDVKYDLEADLKGIDQTITYKGEEFYVHCFVNTRASQVNREIKNYRHNFKGNHLDLPLDLDSSDAKTVGVFKLYSVKHIEKLKQMMEQKINGGKL